LIYGINYLNIFADLKTWRMDFPNRICTFDGKNKGDLRQDVGAYPGLCPSIQSAKCPFGLRGGSHQCIQKFLPKYCYKRMLFSFDAKLTGQTRKAPFNAGLVLIIK
jgi:hypothetical protein